MSILFAIVESILAVVCVVTLYWVFSGGNKK